MGEGHSCPGQDSHSGPWLLRQDLGGDEIAGTAVLPLMWRTLKSKAAKLRSHGDIWRFLPRTPIKTEKGEVTAWLTDVVSGRQTLRGGSRLC